MFSLLFMQLYIARVGTGSGEKFLDQAETFRIRPDPQPCVQIASDPDLENWFKDRVTCKLPELRPLQKVLPPASHSY